MAYGGAVAHAGRGPDRRRHRHGGGHPAATQRARDGCAHPPSAYLQRFTYDTIVHSKSIMEFVIREVGAERVMIGSDYCFDMGVDRPLQFLEQINPPNAQRKMILGENAARLLKL